MENIHFSSALCEKGQDSHKDDSKYGSGIIEHVLGDGTST